MKKAIFKKELKGRFLCEVDIDGKIEHCYVSSSSHLSSYLNLPNKQIILRANKGKNLRTKYTLYAVKYRNTYILLDLNDLNNIFFQFLNMHFENYIKIKKEYNICNYKTDFFITNLNQIVEIKSVISNNEKAYYDFQSHKRAYMQLQKIKELLILGYSVNYIFVMLNPYIKIFRLKDKRKKENMLFLECIKLGMNVKFYKTIYKNKKFQISKISLNKNF